MNVGEQYPSIGNVIEDDVDPEEEQLRVARLVQVEEETLALERL